MSAPNETSHLLLRAIRGEAVERPPVWAMRQAGRWDPEFQRLRGTYSFYEFAENPELAARASLLPRRFGVDALILFYDITTLAVAMGLPFRLVPNQGPMPERPVHSRADIDRLDPQPDPARFAHVIRILQLVRKELAGSLPVLVFAGAPFTLASYCIGTGKNLKATQLFARQQESLWQHLLEKLEQATIYFLQTLATEGADAYQLFDSWAGALDIVEYTEWAETRHRLIFSSVRQVPSILFVKECPYLEAMIRSGANVISLGTIHDLATARRQYPQQVFQGNVDSKLLRDGTPEQVFAATRRCVEAGGGRRHVVNLSHGVDPATPVANFEAYIRAVKAGGP